MLIAVDMPVANREPKNCWVLSASCAGGAPDETAIGTSGKPLGISEIGCHELWLLFGNWASPEA
jgi:hypothetical protein